MADLSLDLCGVKLKNPIIAASGTFGFGREYDELYDIGQLGGISVKGLSLLPRTGNPPSRIAETPSGMLNSVGLQNPGVESFIENDLPWLLTKNVAVIANITGTSVEQYVQLAGRPVRPGGAAGCAAHGLAERQKGAYSDYRHGRHRNRRGRGGVHALRREGRHGRHGEFHRSVRLPAHHSGTGRVL